MGQSFKERANAIAKLVVLGGPAGSLVKLKFEIKLGALRLPIHYPWVCLTRLTGDLFQVHKVLMAIHWTS
jgi:hypothetical protein